MGSDFAALDAELDVLGAGASVDVAAVATAYAGDLSVLPAIDAALAELGRDVAITTPASLVPRAADFLLPPGSHELEIHTSEYGRALPDHAEEITTHHNVVMLDDAVLDAEVDELVQITPESAPLGNFSNALFDLTSVETLEHDPESAFSSLFDEVTKRASPPSRPAPRNEEDTEIFDSGALALEDTRASVGPIEAAFGAEDVDSAEFEIIADAETRKSAPAPANAAHPSSQPPEKRPSFLGRLFGRKDE